ncbi:MAG: outer membrane protein assembly factor BamE [Magnetococcales bacterium]|nr:outer membrane protein assembly factor BamE [Magnetococcales bacterium]
MPTFHLNLPRLLLLILLIGLGGCQARLHESGSVIKPEDVNKIVAGFTDFREVRRLLGPPTIVNSFRRKRWIYIQDRRYENLQRTFSRSANRIEITFNSQGIVEKIDRNFDDELIHPETDPDSELDSDWASWIWNGRYDQPGVNQRQTDENSEQGEPDEASEFQAGEQTLSEQEVEAAMEGSQAKPTENPQAELEKKPPQKKKPWWRFWGPEESDQEEPKQNENNEESDNQAIDRERLEAEEVADALKMEEIETEEVGTEIIRTEEIEKEQMESIQKSMDEENKQKKEQQQQEDGSDKKSKSWWRFW